MSDIEESRKEFEAWTKTFACPPRLDLSEDGTYVFSDAWFGWKAWQAARDRPASDDLALLSLLADIRKAAGDPTGKLMQDELVAHIAALRATSDRAEFMLKRWGVLATVAMEEGYTERAAAIRQCMDELGETGDDE